jgi:hypothetical protein
VKPRLAPFFHRALVALVLVGVTGLGGCRQQYHAQSAHAIGGGMVGKGQTGKKRGIVKNTPEKSGLGGDPMAQLFSKPKGKKQKRNGNPLEAMRTRASQPAKLANPFATRQSSPFGDTNPFRTR